MHYVRNIVIHQRPKPKQFRSLFTRRHYTRRIDSRAQHSNLRFQNLKVSVVPGLAPSPEERNNDEKQPIHPASFPSKVRTKRPIFRGYQEWIHFRTRSLPSQHRGNHTLPLQNLYVGATDPSSKNAAYALHGVLESAG